MQTELKKLKNKKTTYLVLTFIFVALFIVGMALVFINSSSLMMIISLIVRLVSIAFFIVFLCLTVKTDKKIKGLNPKPPTTAYNNNTSTTDEIRKYKALLDDDIITQEEFEAKKKELLNR